MNAINETTAPEDTIAFLDATPSPFDDEEPTVEIPVETMLELQSSERPTRNIRPFRRAKSPTEYSVTKTQETP